MLNTERQQRILDIVRRRGSISVGEAERDFGVSRMTVHRDLDELAGRGVVRRVRGGVVLAQPLPPGEAHARPFEERLGVRRDAKERIAAHLLRLVGSAHSLVLDASSTVFLLGRILEHATSSDLFVVTGSLALFTELAGRTSRGGHRVRAAVHGGELQEHTGALVGPLAFASLAHMRFDFAVMSALGVLADDGLVYVSNPEEVALKRMYLDRAQRGVLAIDESKIGLCGAYPLGPLERFDHVVTELGVLDRAALARRFRGPASGSQAVGRRTTRKTKRAL